MRQPALTAAFALALMGAAGTAQAEPLLPDVQPATITADQNLARGSEYACRRAWRCGPYDCGWRQICAPASWRPDWQTHHYFWRRHQWRRHYW